MLDISKTKGYIHKPGFNFDNSVSEGKIFYEFFPLAGKEYPSCHRHGAIHLRAIFEDGGQIWRCSEEGCGHGCYIPAKKVKNK